MSKLIKIKESILNKLFLTESNNSKAARNKTKRLIAQLSNIDINDPKVDETERAFERKFFGEGLNVDWFIVLEPNAYSWAFADNGNEELAKRYLSYIKRSADLLFPEEQINMKFCADNNIEYNGTVKIKDLLSPEQLDELSSIKAPYREKRNEFITQVRQIYDISQIKGLVDEKMTQEKRESEEFQNNMEINVNQNYEARGPLSFDEAKEIGKYSVPKGEICYTQSEELWDDYSEYDVNNLFVLLRNDWESYNDPKMAVHDGSEKNNGLSSPLNEFNGYDNYGLSMIFVWIDRFGNLCKSNTRWNHEAKYAPGHGVDTAMTETDIAMLMGEPFEQVFGVKKVDVDAYLEENLSSISNLGDIFDDLYEERDGITAVKLGSKYNYVYFDKQENKYKLLWNKPYEDWFTSCDDFCIMDNEVAMVEYNGKSLFIDRDANLHDILEFTKEKLASGVNLNSLFVNVIDDGGVPVRVTYDYIKTNYVNSNTNELLWDAPYEEWLEYSRPFNPMQNYVFVSKKYGGELYMLRYDGKVYNIDEGIRFILKHDNPARVFDYVGDEYEGVKTVRLCDKYNFIRNGSLVWDKPHEEWFDYAANLYNGAARVEKENKINFLKLDGTLLWKNDEWPDTSNWFTGIREYTFKNGLISVMLGTKTYHLGINGVLYDLSGRMVSENKKKRNGNKIIHLSENTVDRLFLTEGGWSKEKKRIVNRCVAIIKHYCGWISDDTASWVEKNIEHKFFEGALAGKAKVRRYEPMITKILVSELGYPTSPFSSYKEQELVDIVKAIDKEVTDGLSPKATCIYDPESNKFTCDDYHSLVEKYHDVVFKPKEQKEAEKNAKIEKYAKESDYEIIPIPDFDTAKGYGDLSSPGNNGDYGRLCYTQGPGTWQNYTNNGLNSCYLCVNKNTWKKWGNGECPPFNEYSPYDEYGLSMIWVFVGPDGSMVCSNTRWNHGAQGNIKKYNSIYGGENCDHSFSEEGITKVTKYPFREFFLPKENAFEDIKETIYPIKDKIIKELENGTKTLHIDDITINKASDNLYFVDNGKKSTFLKINPFGFVFDGLCDNISSSIQYHGGNFYVVRSDYKYNLLNEEKGELVLNQWVDNISPIGFDEYGIETNALKIRVDGKFNIIDFEGEPLFPMWVENYTLMRKFNACVLERNKKYYLYSFDTNSFITDDTFTNFKHDNYSDDFILVGEDGSFVTMTPNKELKRMSLSNIEEFVRSHIAIGEYEIDTDSTHMFVFDEVPVTNGLTTISDDCGYGLQKGMIKDSLYAVYLNGVYNIGCNGKLLLPFWLDSAPREQQYFEGKVYTFKKDGKENVVTKDGVLFDGPIEQWPASIISVEGSNVLVLDCEGHGHQRANLTDFNRFMYDLNTPIEDLPASIEIVGRCAIVRIIEGEENRYNLFDLDSWSFIFNSSVRVFSQDEFYTKGRHLCLIEDRETMLSNFYDTDRKEFILKSGIPSKKLTEFGQSEMVEDMPVAVLRSEVDRRVNFISPDGEFLFGPDENTWPLYEDDEEHYIEPLSAFRFNDGYAIADLHKFKLISNEHFKDIIVLEEYRYFELIRQDGSKIIYDYEKDTFVRSNLDAENHFEGYDGTSLIDYLNKNFDKVDEFIPGQVYKVGKYTVGKTMLRQNLVTVGDSGSPVLILPEWFDYIMHFNKNANSNLVKCTNNTYAGCKIFNLNTMEFVTDKYVLMIFYKMGGVAIQDAKVYDNAYNLINSNGELVFDNFILSDVDEIGRYPHTAQRFLKITNMEGDYNVYDFKDNKLMLNNWAASIYLLDGPNEAYKNYFIVKAINDRYYAVREDGTELFTDLNATDMYTYGGNSVKITTSNGDTLIGDLETGKVHQDVRVRTESRKTSGKIIRISNDKLNKLFIY